MPACPHGWFIMFPSCGRHADHCDNLKIVNAQCWVSDLLVPLLTAQLPESHFQGWAKLHEAGAQRWKMRPGAGNQHPGHGKSTCYKSKAMISLILS